MIKMNDTLWRRSPGAALVAGSAVVLGDAMLGSGVVETTTGGKLVVGLALGIELGDGASVTTNSELAAVFAAVLALAGACSDCVGLPAGDTAAAAGDGEALAGVLVPAGCACAGRAAGDCGCCAAGALPCGCACCCGCACG